MARTWLRAAVAAVAAAVLVVGVLAPASAAAPPKDLPQVVHVSGFGPAAGEGECTDGDYAENNAPAGIPPLIFTGGLEGCYYTDTSDPRVTAIGGGRFRLVDRGTETFVGEVPELGEDIITFRSSFVIIAEFQGNPLDDADATLLSGFCHHPLIEGGKGVLHFVDDVDTGLIHYRGVLRF
jgi:hypothetical protein